MERGVKISIPPIGQYASRKEWEAAVWRKIVRSRELLVLLTTLYERRNLALRAAVLDRLRAGKSYRNIGDELWLSSQTISGIKKALQRNGYRSYWERGKTERKKRQYSPVHALRKRPYVKKSFNDYGIIQKL